MNLTWKHLLPILVGGAVGAGLGWLAAITFKLDFVPVGSPIASPWAGAGFGSIAGVGFAVIVIVARAARDPKVGPAPYFMRINGMGSTLLGHSEPHADGSYATTEWFTLFWIPVFPVCRYRVTRHANLSTPFSTPYSIHAKLPLRWGDAARVYGITVLVILAVFGFLYLLLR